jgi:hypothetical protein
LGLEWYPIKNLAIVFKEELKIRERNHPLPKKLFEVTNLAEQRQNLNLKRTIVTIIIKKKRRDLDTDRPEPKLN